MAEAVNTCRKKNEGENSMTREESQTISRNTQRSISAAINPARGIFVRYAGAEAGVKERG